MAPSGAGDGLRFQPGGASAPLASKKRSHSVRENLVKLKNFLVPKSEESKAKHAAKKAAKAAAKEAAKQEANQVANQWAVMPSAGLGQVDRIRRGSSSSWSTGSSHAIAEGTVSFDHGDVNVVSHHDERPVDVENADIGSRSTRHGASLKRTLSGLFSRHRGHDGPHIEEIGRPGPADAKEYARKRKKRAKAVHRSAEAFLSCLEGTFTKVVKPEKVRQNSRFRKSCRKVRQTMSQAVVFTQARLDPVTLGAASAVTGGKSIERDFADRMSAFIDTCDHAGLPASDQGYVQPLRDALKGADLYGLNRTRLYARDEDFRDKAKAMYGNSGSDSDDSADSHVKAERKRRVDVLMSNLDQAATAQMKFLLQQAPVGALFNAGLLIQMRGEDYKELLPVIADGFVDLYKGYRCGLHNEGETEQDYIARVIEEHAPEWMQLPIRIALGADPDSAACVQTDVANTIARSMLGAKQLPIAALLALGKLLEKRSLSGHDRAVSRAMAATLNLSDAGIQKENVAHEVGKVMEAFRHYLGLAGSGISPDAGDAQYLLGKRLFDNMNGIAAALPAQEPVGAVVPFDNQAVQSSLARMADASKADTNRPVRRRQGAQAGPGGGVAETALDDATAHALKMARSPLPAWGQIPERRGEMLVYHRGGVVRRVIGEIWFHVQSAFKSGRDLQERRAQRRHVNVASGVHRVVHNLFLPDGGTRTSRKLDVETRALIASIKQLARSEGEDYAWAYVREQMEVALATGRRGQLQDAGKVLFDDPIKGLVLSGQQRRWWTRAWNYVIGKFFETPSDSSVVERAGKIREVAGESLHKVVVHILLRDVLARVVGAVRDARPVETLHAFRSLMEAYAASGRGKDFETWLRPAAQLLNPDDAEWMMERLERYSFSNGGHMIDVFQPKLDEVKLLVDKDEYIVYEDFAEALYRAFVQVHADREMGSAGGSASSDADSEGSQAGTRSGSEPGSRGSSQNGSREGSRDGSPTPRFTNRNFGHLSKTDLVLATGKTVLSQFAPSSPRETAL
ncbi:hypothetical protein CEY04_23895 [Achromobacter sp. HZ28]|nr:hypothetical protein CEY05_25060 [Achromobacter sp. HZ34]OWT73119.1 hypothetical protein CEY04_23895 [Achromobacter sp. HZ28]